MRGTAIKKSLCLLLVFSIAMSLGGCGKSYSASVLNLMDGIEAKPVTAAEDLSANSAELIDFCARLLKASNVSSKNTLVSPLSVLLALTMTANGAVGETREQLEAAFGMSIDELNIFLYSYMKSLEQGASEVKLANSIWINSDERFTANQEFLQTNADYYNADLYTLPFDKETKNTINNWISNKTDNLIREALNEVDSSAVMYLINTLLFDAQWETIYTDDHVIDEASFRTEDSQELPIKLMESTENIYIKGDRVEGFYKPYAGDRFAFVALCPDETLSIDELISTLDGKTLFNLLSSKESTSVKVYIPKFKSEFSANLTDAMKKMGVTDAFSLKTARFDKLGQSSAGNIFISKILHKTYISVAEKGTKAGAATIVEANDSAAPFEQKTIRLDRPFVYMLLDCQNNLPLFIGTLMNPAE